MEKKEIAELFMKGIDVFTSCSWSICRGAWNYNRGSLQDVQHLAAVWVLVRLVVLLSEQ